MTTVVSSNENNFFSLTITFSAEHPNNLSPFSLEHLSIDHYSIKTNCRTEQFHAKRCKLNVSGTNFRGFILQPANSAEIFLLIWHSSSEERFLLRFLDFLLIRYAQVHVYGEHHCKSVSPLTSVRGKYMFRSTNRRNISRSQK